MMIHYGKHLGGFKVEPGPADFERISYLETQDGLELQEQEIELDKEREIEELEHLGEIGFKKSGEE